jgi:PfaB family protein
MKNRIPIAVVGMGGVFPGAVDLETFWHNIINKIDSTCEIPKDRWLADPDLIYDARPASDKAISKRACLIHADILRSIQSGLTDIRIDSALLTELDPLYHLILHAGKQAFSTCVTSALDKKRIGVILAAIALPTDSSSLITREILERCLEEKLFGDRKKGCHGNQHTPLAIEKCLAGRVTGLPAAILSKALGLGGGAYTLDAACASGIYTVKLACDELRSYRADAILAGGVSRPECLYTQVGFSQLRALSPSGRCAPFDANSDGLVVGEGAGVLVLKRLDDAIRQRDTIHGVIRGIGLSNDMRGNLLAPDSEGQIRAMKNAYESALWSPSDVDLIECHGTGTPLGDSTEIKSLRNLWNKFGCDEGHCAIGSVKSMIGHLLTGAGAAGIIKTLLAIRNKILPPSINFEKPPASSPLNHSPFRVQKDAEAWCPKNANQLRRAAVSAFGFGGINGHLLLEEWNPENTGIENIFHCNAHTAAASRSMTSGKPSHVHNVRHCGLRAPIAIVGMEAVFGSLSSLRNFQEAVFKGTTTISKRPRNRWKGCEQIAGRYLQEPDLWGGYMDELSIGIGEFHIPPKEIPDILPQHLLMLKVASMAMKDAGLPLREDRPRMGVIIGMDYDFEANNFHLRWRMSNSIKAWQEKFSINCSPDETAVWLESLKESCSPALTASRTLGALGGVIASRIAKEFRFGGPSFTVSSEETSGFKALEIGVRSLQQEEADAVLVGAIDLAGDIRNILTKNQATPFSKKNRIRLFGPSADGTLPGEGAAALVLKRLEHAKKDGDRIYAVIKGIGKASGEGIEKKSFSKKAYLLSLKRAFEDSNVSPSSISYIETHGSGNPMEDRMEADAVNTFFGNLTKMKMNPCAIGSVKPNIGHAGAASGIASIVKTSLCLYQEIIPPLKNHAEPADDFWNKQLFYIPICPQYWLRDRKDGPRRSCVSAMTADGNYSHVILESFEYESMEQIPEKVTRERKRPLGLNSTGLFCVEGDNKASLVEGLDALYHHIQKPAGTQPGFPDERNEFSNSKTNPSSQDPKSERTEGRAPHHVSFTGSKKLSREFEKKTLPCREIEIAAHTWYIKNRPYNQKRYAVSIVASNFSQLENWITDAKNAVLADVSQRMNSLGGIAYSPVPLEKYGETAFVFPGSGNHHTGMGREFGVQWPEILRRMDVDSRELKAQFFPCDSIPWRTLWQAGWSKNVSKKSSSDLLNMIFGQMAFGGLVSNLMLDFNIKPSAVVGYSLGESIGLFALNVWPDRGEMLKRMRETDLFKTELCGPCHAARKAWQVPTEEEVDWCVAAINRPADMVRDVTDRWSTVRLLIVNTPEECVIGGRKAHVKAAIQALHCKAIYLDGIATVHCDAVTPVADAYRKLHMFPTNPPEGIRFYSCALESPYHLTSENVSESILKQAVSGFDFPATVKRAYEDGVRVFLEIGPGNSCTRMIRKILDTNPCLAVSASVPGEDSHLTILKLLGSLIAERIPVSLGRLYELQEYPPAIIQLTNEKPDKVIKLSIGGKLFAPALPPRFDDVSISNFCFDQNERIKADSTQPADSHTENHALSGLMDCMWKNLLTTAEVHKLFLEFSENSMQSFARAFSFQTQLLENIIADEDRRPRIQKVKKSFPGQNQFCHGYFMSPDHRSLPGEPAFSRDMCMEFAIGSVAKVLGPEFSVVDNYKARVRLPDEPLMLVDRIISVEGEKGSLGSGCIITEHDVLPGAWYLEGGRAPVCISVEAGQADLFLCAYLGIDFEVKGQRTYRLLDATVKFHRGLPRPGDTIRYRIKIEKFVRQADTYLFFFNFEGLIDDSLLITMTNGCAGFFTEEEVKNSGGIILTDEETRSVRGKRNLDLKDLAPVSMENYNDAEIESLRCGDLSGCFGEYFDGIVLSESLRLPGKQMKLIDRILEFDPAGGRYGIGRIRAEADVRPDDWFLVCHFKDDRVMPGTLMYECCNHTLRVFIQRMGWVTEKPGVCYEPVSGVESVLKCRGPVTPETRHVIYDVEIKEIGYSPEPYAIADAMMYADGRRIVSFKNMSTKMTGISRDEIESFWKLRKSGKSASLKTRRPLLPPGARPPSQKEPVFDKNMLLAFATGKPSEAFGSPYSIFDKGRFVARLPGPPYLFIDRISHVEPEPWVLKPGGWIEAQYDVMPEAWYFHANRTPSMPLCVLMEIAFQPCGWLAAYLGSSLKNKKDLRFRNLGGNSIIHEEVLPDPKTLTMRARMKRVSEAADMIIEQFDMQVLQADKIVYEGDTVFGFFTSEAMAQQKGIRNVPEKAYLPYDNELREKRPCIFGNEPPFEPGGLFNPSEPSSTVPLSMPAKALMMLDGIETYLTDGGPFGLGFIRGIKEVKPEEWFFKAHFYQDPVCPGSLGIESFIQLLKFIALDRWGHLSGTHRFAMLTGKSHHWTFRGQIVPENKKIEVEAIVTNIQNAPVPMIQANGFLKVDGLYIYKMDDFGIQLIPMDQAPRSGGKRFK